MTEFDCDIHQEDKDEIWACLSCYNEGVAREERERIIKLLEEHKGILVEDNGFECCMGGQGYSNQHAIALIKGEQQ